MDVVYFPLLQIIKLRHRNAEELSHAGKQATTKWYLGISNYTLCIQSSC